MLDVRWSIFRGGEHAPRQLAKAHAISLALAPGRERNTIAIFQEAAQRSIGQFQRLLAAPGALQQAATRVGRRATDRARGEQVARPQVAAADRVMRQLL